MTTAATTPEPAATFTPGPWYTTEGADFFRIRQKASDYVVANSEDGGHPELEVIPFNEQLANARLIAAAPDMLAVLRNMFIAYVGVEGVHPGAMAECRAILARLDAEVM